MSESQIVSLPVSSGVSSPNAEIISAKQAPKRPRSSPGLYLIKTGSAYMFQMRLPKSISGEVKRPLRVGLGVIPKPQARKIADRLAVIAREQFERIEIAMSKTNDDENGFWPLMEDMLAGDLDGLDEDAKGKRAWQAVTMSLKSALYDISNPPPPSTAEEEGNFAMMRGLVQIAQEKARKDAGEDYNKALGDNAELLARRLVERAKDDPVSLLMPSLGSGSIGKGKISARAGLVNAKVKTEVDKDRRFVEREPSDKPLFSIAASEYLAQRVTAMGEASGDIKTAEMRLNIFVELIGDHPIDRYTPTDLQAFINLMQFWPSKHNDKPSHLSAREIIDSNRDFSKKSIAKNTLQNGFMGVIKPVFSNAATQHDFDNPVKNVALKYPKAARDAVSAEPLSAKKLTQLFRAGVQSPYIDDVMMPLLGLLTSRRLGLLTHLVGTDITEKFDGIWVAEVEGIAMVGGKWVRRPIKTTESGRYFVLHNFLVEIGYVEWARKQGDSFLFPQLMQLANPPKNASKYMRRLFDKAGIKESPGERFHSLRGDYISQARENKKIGERERRMQAGHAIGGDDHNKYGWKTLTESEAEMFATLPLNPKIDFSMFRGLDFDRLAKTRRRPEDL
ncbi:site-specific integrase [Hoeflea alexandrii]